LGLSELIERQLTDGAGKEHSLAAGVRQSIYSRPAGYEDVNDAEPLPGAAFRLIGSEKVLEQRSGVDLTRAVIRD
jgi:hypothetical protein